MKFGFGIFTCLRLKKKKKRFTIEQFTVTHIKNNNKTHSGHDMHMDIHLNINIYTACYLYFPRSR